MTAQGIGAVLVTTAQGIGAVLVTTAVCTVAALVALTRQAGRHADDRAALLREQLDAFRAGQESMREDEPWPESVLLGDGEEEQFWAIAAELGSDDGERP